MLQISEFLPNPSGKDALGEWIEIENKSSNTIQIGGWSLKNEKGSSLYFSKAEILSGQFLVIKKPALSISLKNTNGSISLFSPTGVQVDQINFLGVAPEEKTFGRINGETMWLLPTPGFPNQSGHSLVLGQLPFNRPLHQDNFSILPFLVIPILITAFVIYTVKQDEALSQLFAKGNRSDSNRKNFADSFEEEESTIERA